MKQLENFLPFQIILWFFPFSFLLFWILLSQKYWLKEPITPFFLLTIFFSLFQNRQIIWWRLAFIKISFIQMKKSLSKDHFTSNKILLRLYSLPFLFFCVLYINFFFILFIKSMRSKPGLCHVCLFFIPFLLWYTSHSFTHSLTRSYLRYNNDDCLVEFSFIKY